MIYLTGATGHIGNNLARKLEQRNIDFKILARAVSTPIEKFVEKTIIGDIFSYDFLDNNLKSGDILIHLAAYINLKNNQAELTQKINYEGVKMIVDFCVLKNVYLVFSSSVDAIYTDNYLVTEPDKLIMDDNASLYQKTKALATNYLLDKINYGTIKAMIVYPSAVIGINDFKPSAVGKEIKKCFKRKLCLYFHGGYNFIDVEDVAEAIINGIQKDITGSFILSGHYVSLYDMYQLIFKTVNRKVLMVKIPIFLIKLITRLIPKYRIMINALLSEHNYDNKAMIEKLGVNPKPVSSSLNNMVNWFKEVE